MFYSVEWIKKNMGISRKALRVYEEKNLLKPNKNSANGYREYSVEDLERIWYIKLFVELGYSLKEIENIVNDPNFDFRESISEKIKVLEEKRRQLDLLIGHAKFIKSTGMMPTVPKIMGSIKFADFVDYAYKTLNVDADPQSAMLYQILQYVLSKTNTEWDDQDIKQLFEQIISKPESEWSEEDMLPIIKLFGDIDIKALLDQNLYWEELASLSPCDVSHPNVQNLVKKIYDFERNHIFSEYSNKITPQWFALHAPTQFSASDIAIINERKFGKEKCEFIIAAIEYFGNHSENVSKDNSIS